MLDLKTIPFSRFGSYFAINKVDEDFYLKDMHCGDEAPFNIFKIEFYINKNKFTPKVEYSETYLKFYDENNNNRNAIITFGLENTINILADGLNIRLTAIKNKYDSFIFYGENRWLYELYTKEIKFYFHEIYGQFKINSPWNMVGNDYIKINILGEQEKTYLIIEDFTTVQNNKSCMSFEDALSNNLSDFSLYKDKFTCKNPRYKNSFDLATYINWSSVVRPSGILSHYAMYMSKNWMNNIWSWDNCFNAMMLKDNFIDLALNQFEVFVEHQDEYGQYPDFINNKFKSFNCVKPPIHAFSLKKLM
ncbi:MAG: hypothetical protein ACK5LV_02870, partial [Lachnospirales bacterium]